MKSTDTLVPVRARTLLDRLSWSPAAFGASEDRCAPRYRVAIPAQLRFAQQRAFAVMVTDISVAGFGCDALLSAARGKSCWLRLPGLVSLPCEIAHCAFDGTGAAFSNLLDPAVVDRLVARYKVVDAAE